MKNILHKNEKEFKTKKLSDLTVRLISSVVLVVLLLLYLSFSSLHTELAKGTPIEEGLPPASLAMGILSLLASAGLVGLFSIEITGLFGITKLKNAYKLGIVAASIGLFFLPIGTKASIDNLFLYQISSDATLEQFKQWYTQIGLIVLFIILVFAFVKLNNKNSVLETFMMIGTLILIIFAMKGFTYLSLSIGTVNEQTQGPIYGFTTIIWIWMIIIFTDTFAYIVGVKWGRNKMAPVISPKKSWEGAIAGFGIASALGIAFALSIYFGFNEFKPMSSIVFQLKTNSESDVTPILFYIALTLLISILSQVGDLLFSAIKRYFNVKDFSNLIPGHGGVLDRLDSFILVFFFMFVLSWFI